MQFNRSLGPLRISGDVRAVLAGLVLFALLVNLGSWQLGRAGEKSALASRWEARAAMPAMAPEVLLPTRHPPKPLRHSLTVRCGGRHLLRRIITCCSTTVCTAAGPGITSLRSPNRTPASSRLNLGWLAGDPSRRTTPTPTLPTGPVELEGRIYVPSGAPLMMQKPEPPATLPATVQTLYWDNWQRSLEALSGRAVFPYEVRIQPDSPHALVAEWTVVNQSPSKHIGYAVQWFAMAAVLVIIGLLRLTNLTVPSSAGVAHMTDTAMPSQRRRARLVLILIAGIPLSMMLGATALWWAVEQGHVDVLGSVGTANHGKLIDPPRSVTDVVFQHEGVAETLWQDLPAKWRLLVVQRGENCDAICQQQLYQTRQIHLALGKDFNRVGRVVLSDTAPTAVTLTPEAGQGVAGVSLSEWLAQEHVGMTALTVSSERLSTLVPEVLASPAQWYVVDPAGWIMMRVSDDLYYKDVISDLRFLLKHSGG